MERACFVLNVWKLARRDNVGSIVEIRMAAASGFSVISDWTQHHALPALRSAYMREQQLYYSCREAENEVSIVAWLCSAFL